MAAMIGELAPSSHEAVVNSTPPTDTRGVVVGSKNKAAINHWGWPCKE